MGLDIFETFATDETLEVEGKWHDLGSGSRILVARQNNTNYLNVFSELYQEHGKAIEDGAAAPEGSKERKAGDKASLDINVATMARTILLGWENLTYKGKPLEYSVENAEMLLRIKDFRVLVFGLMTDIENFRQKQEEAQEKN